MANRAARERQQGVADYDPIRDVRQRYPQWRFKVCDLRGIPEVICRGAHLILLDEKADPLGALAQAIAHLDLGHGLDKPMFSEAECAEADALAAERMRG